MMTTRMIRFAARVALLLLTLAGCKSNEPRQREWLTTGKQAYEGKQYREAIEQLTYFLSREASGADAAFAYYIRGLSQALVGNRPAAYQDLQQAIGGQSAPDVAWKARVALGTLYFEDARWAEAARWYAEAVERMPATPPLDDVLYRLGVCRERSGQWPGALDAFEQLMQRMPGSRLVEAAKRRLSLRASHFAVQCGVFSQQSNADNLQLDLERKGYLAYVRQEPRDNRTMNVVLVGRFADYATALAELARVQQDVPDARLWP